MHRVVVDGLRRRQLDDLAQIHDGDTVRDVPHDAQVVRDEHVRQAELALQAAEQVEHLSLDGHVERAHGLIAHDQLRAERQSARDVDALTLAAGELVRIAVDVLAVEADDLHQVDDALHALVLVGDGLVDDHRLLDDLRAGLARIERRVRILEDHLHVLALLLRTRPLEVERLALEEDLAGGRLMQTHDAAAQRRLAAAGLADDAERLAAVHLQVDVAQRVQVLRLAADFARADLELLREIVDLEKHLFFLSTAHRRSPPLPRSSLLSLV